MPVVILYNVKYYSIANESHVKSHGAWKNKQSQDHLHQTQNKSKKKSYSQKREKARASVPKKLKLRVSLLVETEKGGCFRVFKDFVSYHYIYKSG